MPRAPSPYAIASNAEGQLVVYALGPGIGESIVVQTPDGATIVVDACTNDGSNLTAELLRGLGCSAIDLLVFSHPDTDPVRGGAELVTWFAPREVWLYPNAVSLRTQLLQVLRASQRDGDESRVPLQELSQLLAALEPLRENNTANEVASNTREWTSPRRAVAVHPLAPLQSDIFAANRQIVGIIDNAGRQPRLAERVVAFLRGKRTVVGDHPNTVSIALSVIWGEHRVLLAGDVEAGAGPNAGWRGVRARLAARNALHLLQRMRVVKVAHHASNNAFDEDTWREHATGSRVSVALVCPYTPNELPATRALGEIRRHAALLAVSSTKTIANRRVQAARWRPPGSAARAVIEQPAWTLPVVAAVVTAAGEVTVHLAKGARAWRAR